MTALRYNVGDTYPALRGLAADRAGALPLEDADAVTVLLTSDRTTIEGPATVLASDDPRADPDGLEGGPFNWLYEFAESDLVYAGVYTPSLEVVWDDASDPPKRQTIPAGVEPVHVGVDVWRPTVDQVAQEWLRARTYSGLDGTLAGGEVVGTFTADTNPTREQAEVAVEGAIVAVLAHFPRGVVPQRSYLAAQKAATLYAALEIELGYFPEQSPGDSAFLQLRGLSDAAMRVLVDASNVADLFAVDSSYLNGGATTVVVGLAPAP
jgi:hypothetical protein